MVEKVLIISVLVMLCFPVVVFAQEAPSLGDTKTMQVVSAEHKSTRKYVSTELQRQRNEFFKEMDSRATYYENTANSMINDAVWKLGLMWGGITFAIASFYSLLSRKLEQKRYRLLRDSLIADVKRTMSPTEKQDVFGNDDKQKTKSLFGRLRKKEKESGIKESVSTVGKEVADGVFSYTYNVER